jgi:hypothetical protein
VQDVVVDAVTDNPNEVIAADEPNTSGELINWMVLLLAEIPNRVFLMAVAACDDIV